MTRAVNNMDDRSDQTPGVPEHLERSLKDRWRRYRKESTRCRRRFSDESVHQLRVETRRLLALIDLLAELTQSEEIDRFRRPIKKLFNRFAPLRDTQVQRCLVERLLPRFPQIRPFAQTLNQREKRLSKKLDKRLRYSNRKDLKTRFSRLDKKLGDLLARRGLRAKGQQVLERHIGSCFVRLAKSRSLIDPSRPATIHRTRVAFKRFRYLMELSQPILPGITLRLLVRMHDYQTLMGEVQDWEVLEDTLVKHTKDEPELAAKLKPVQAAIHRKRQLFIARFLARADELWRFWPIGSPTSESFRNRMPCSTGGLGGRALNQLRKGRK